MSLTLEQARQDLRSMLREHAPIRWEDRTLDDLLDQAQFDLAALTLGYQRRAVFASSDSPPVFLEGVRLYHALAPVGSGGLALDDMMKPLHVFLNNDSLPLLYAPMVPHADRRAEGEGEPRYYFWFAGHLGVMPLPDAAFVATDYTFEIFYAALPTADWTTGPSVLQDDIADLIPLLAYSWVMLARHQWDTAAVAFQQTFQLASEYRQLSLSRALTTREMVKQAQQAERRDEPPRLQAVPASSARRRR